MVKAIDKPDIPPRNYYPWHKVDDDGKALRVSGSDAFKLVQKAAHVRGLRNGVKYRTKKTARGGLIWRDE